MVKNYKWDRDRLDGWNRMGGWKSLQAPILWAQVCGANNAVRYSIIAVVRSAGWSCYIRKLTLQSFPVLAQPSNRQRPQHILQYSSKRPKPWPDSFSACSWQLQPASSGRIMRPTLPTTTALITGRGVRSKSYITGFFINSISISILIRTVLK